MTTPADRLVEIVTLLAAQIHDVNACHDPAVKRCDGMCRDIVADQLSALSAAGYAVVPQPEIRRRAKDAHIACVAQRSNGHWGVYCLACSDTADDYVFPCKVQPGNPYWPPGELHETKAGHE